MASQSHILLNEVQITIRGADQNWISPKVRNGIDKNENMKIFCQVAVEMLGHFIKSYPPCVCVFYLLKYFEVDNFSWIFNGLQVNVLTRAYM